MRLSVFITHNKEAILKAWEDFARTILPPSLGMDIAALRHHASFMLDTIVLDLEAPQSKLEQVEKSQGRGPHQGGESFAEAHVEHRLRAGYTVNQLASEFRALRASVLRLWGAADRQVTLPTDMSDANRFNEAIDQALCESLARFSQAAVIVESERFRLDAILQAAPVGISMTDRNGKLVLENAENRKIWGDHPMSENVAEYAEWRGWWADGSGRHGRRIEPHEWAAARALKGERTQRDVVEIEPFCSPGMRKTISLHAAPIHDADGNIAGAVVAKLDITAQVATEVASRVSEAKFRTIANAMPQMVWSTLPDGYHDYYNEQWYLFTGVRDGSTDGEGWNDMFHPDEQPGAWTAWRTSLATGEPYEIQYRLRHHSGQYRWVLGRALPVCDDDGKIIRWMGTCTDIHDQKLAEEDIKQGSRRTDDFLAMLAHELRNPLAPISTASQMLRRKGITEERVVLASEIISRQVTHMSSLVDDLLDVSRVKRGLVTLAKERQDLRPILNSAVEQVRSLVEARGHTLTVRMDSETTCVDADRVRLAQVISNLLNNAAKYTPQGGSILLAVEVHDHQVRLSVSDNGMGMDASLLPYVFDLFAQGTRTPDRTQGGLGLGLALVKSMVDLHGGSVAAASGGAGQGSTFTVLLPLCEAPARAPGILPVEGGQTIQGRSLRILVVDDNTDAAQTLAFLLEAAGHQVTVKYDGSSALDHCRNQPPPDAFILDIGLPDLDGYELARRLRTSPGTYTATLIALTGYGQAHDRVLSKAAGFDHHFVKPVDVVALEKILAQMA